MKKATRSVEQSSQSQGDITTTEAPNKICRVLAYLITGKSLNRFEAERIGEHCLHSTISRLTNHYDMTFARKAESVPNNWGRPCRVVRYWLSASERKRATVLLSFLSSTAGQRRELAA
ncbi:hypothetical protein [Pseudomonas sp. PS02290]|uniref:hypothetical protein n=1 Tax=Pseudomonas sp. PS02290 TaxID=2991430 RepID=UPI00249A6C76|nr:hypothetical protein [Pseudomonas sp. PS02290]